jgi:hypothetical protein
MMEPKCSQSYKDGLSLILSNNCCLGQGCLEEYETKNLQLQYFPYISPKCGCTICKKCIDGTVEREADDWKGYTIACPPCFVEKAFNLRHLVPNRGLASALQETRRLMMTPPGTEQA